MGLGSVGEFLTSSADSNVLRSLLEGLKNHKSTIQKYILPGTVCIPQDDHRMESFNSFSFSILGQLHWLHL